MQAAQMIYSGVILCENDYHSLSACHAVITSFRAAGHDAFSHIHREHRDWLRDWPWRRLDCRSGAAVARSLPLRVERILPWWITLEPIARGAMR